MKQAINRVGTFLRVFHPFLIACAVFRWYYFQYWRTDNFQHSGEPLMSNGMFYQNVFITPFAILAVCMVITTFLFWREFKKKKACICLGAVFGICWISMLVSYCYGYEYLRQTAILVILPSALVIGAFAAAAVILSACRKLPETAK